jgi:hypothetical protein
MWHQFFIAWNIWAKLLHVPLWNPYGASITLMLFACLVGYVLKSMRSRE